VNRLGKLGGMVWREPPRGGFPNPALLVGLSGLDQLRQAVDGQLPRPPISYLTGMLATEVGAGSSVFTMPASGWLASPQGLLSGGVLAILADGPLGGAVQCTLPPATAYTTFELSLSLLRPVHPDGRTITARGRHIHGEGSLALSEVFVHDADERLLAHGTARCVIFPPAHPRPASDLEMPHAPEPTVASAHPYQRPPQGEVLPDEVWASTDGLAILTAHIAGDLPQPPVGHLTGLRPVQANEGEAVFALPATGWLCAPHGNLEGGAIALLADGALAAAVQTTIPAGCGHAPIDVKVTFLRPVPPDGSELVARARVNHRGSTVATASAEVVDAAGKKVALATGSAMIMPHPMTASTPIAVVEHPPR
jgi:uncharacterized protein (TIGR00369 family)